jgi:hypothetical protein
MKQRRSLIAIVLAVAAVLLAAAVTWAAPSPEGALRAAFQSGVTGGGVIRFQVPNSQAELVAAPAIGLDYRISPFLDQELCTGTVYGTWVTWLWTEAERAAGDPGLLTTEFDLDGVPLVVQRTSLHRIKPPAGPNDWGFSEGIPVLGTLEAGSHTLTWRVTFDGITFPDETINLLVADCDTD